MSPGSRERGNKMRTFLFYLESAAATTAAAAAVAAAAATQLSQPINLAPGSCLLAGLDGSKNMVTIRPWQGMRSITESRVIRTNVALLRDTHHENILTNIIT
jgi:hypothetical protein